MGRKGVPDPVYRDQNIELRIPISEMNPLDILIEATAATLSSNRAKGLVEAAILLQQSSEISVRMLVEAREQVDALSKKCPHPESARKIFEQHVASVERIDACIEEAVKVLVDRAYQVEAEEA